MFVWRHKPYISPPNMSKCCCRCSSRCCWWVKRVYSGRSCRWWPVTRSNLLFIRPWGASASCTFSCCCSCSCSSTIYSLLVPHSFSLLSLSPSLSFLHCYTTCRGRVQVTLEDKEQSKKRRKSKRHAVIHFSCCSCHFLARSPFMTQLRCL